MGAARARRGESLTRSVERRPILCFDDGYVKGTNGTYARWCGRFDALVHFFAVSTSFLGKCLGRSAAAIPIAIDDASHTHWILITGRRPAVSMLLYCSLASMCRTAGRRLRQLVFLEMQTRGLVRSLAWHHNNSPRIESRLSKTRCRNGWRKDSGLTSHA